MKRIIISAAILLFALITAARAEKETLGLFEPFKNPSNGLMSVEDLKDWQVEMLIAVEDPNFYEHNGVDGKTPGSGRTTITQALVKRMYFENWKPGPINKFRQTRIAQNKVHPNISKQTQLNAFLNLAYFGHDQGVEIQGFEAAAQHYFGWPVEGLSERQFAQLVGSLIGPNTWTPGTGTGEERAERIARLVDGDCTPRGPNDVYLEGCALSR